MNVQTVTEPTVELDNWWSFLLKTWLVAFPIVVSAIIGNFAWLNYEGVQARFHREAQERFAVAQADINAKLWANDAAHTQVQMEILISLGKISTELELHRQK